MPKKYRKKDPHAKRESEKYKNPIPSREFIIQYLDEMAKPMSWNDMVHAFEIKSESKMDALRWRLRAMVRDGQLMSNRRGKFALVNQLDLVRGVVCGHKDGYGFVITEDEGDDIFLPPRQMRSLFPDDEVLVQITGMDDRGRRSGVVADILVRNTEQIVGRFYKEDHIAYVVPDHKSIQQDILIPEGKRARAHSGQYVVVQITAQPSERRQAIGEVIEILGDEGVAGLETEVMIRSFDIPHEWPEAVLAEVAQYTKEVRPADLVGRKDLRDIPFVTIDGENAKDFDDAVYCEARKNGGWRLYVAIADVTHYVKPGSALDEEAYLRGNSVYFPGRVVPMLPEVLSNELCSLKPNIDRLAMICEMTVSAEGKLTRSMVYEGVIKSHARLIYEHVAKMLQGQSNKNMALLPQLQQLHALFLCLHKQRALRGALEFETTETRILYDKKHRIKKIVPVERTVAHQIIEECMLLANIAVTRFLHQRKIPFLYRVHEGPDEQRLQALSDFIRGVGLRITWKGEPQPEDYARLLQRIKGRPDEQLIQTTLLRSLQQAVYTPDNKGHFGLAYKNYAHFTSPIRRYPDVIVHRAIRHCLAHQEVADFAYDFERLKQFGEHTSRTERRADEATREVVNWLKCEYMQNKVGQRFAGIITGVTGFGVFVELSDVYVEGLVHISSLKDDYYQFDATHHKLTGRHSGVVYRLGDPINVLVAKVNIEEREIDFDLV